MDHLHSHRERVTAAIAEKAYDTACGQAADDLAGQSLNDIARRQRYGAVAVLAGTPDYGQNDNRTDIVDALANVLHYAVDQGVDVDDLHDLVETAIGHVQAEIRELS